MISSSKNLSAIMFIWSLAGLAFLIFMISRIHARGIVETAECLFNKSPDDYTDWFTHLPQLIYRVLFETCDHNYR
ncbi:hypothetical protein BBB56_10450 [Candidatus Pantoea deserta]|uniref:Uncharacterized protein n=1 Tax=Candidatus Pantoea deserta TaxID=1869313 RepID=A0A3N4PC34_9GAMM|nr:hypothetical protein BBB56_10450 [Pantoea deserta]